MELEAPRAHDERNGSGCDSGRVEDLLTRPLYGHLATSPDGTVQVNPMGFEWDGERIRFTHTDQRQKYRNIAHNPAVAMSIIDPDNPYRYLEVRGVVEDIERDPEAKFYLHLNDRYDGPLTGTPRRRPQRVICVRSRSACTRRRTRNPPDPVAYLRGITLSVN